MNRPAIENFSNRAKKENVSVYLSEKLFSILYEYKFEQFKSVGIFKVHVCFIELTPNLSASIYQKLNKNTGIAFSCNVDY